MPFAHGAQYGALSMIDADDPVLWQDRVKGLDVVQMLQTLFGQVQVPCVQCEDEQAIPRHSVPVLMASSQHGIESWLRSCSS